VSARGVGTNGEGPSYQAGDSRANNHCFGWFNHVPTFLSVFGICLFFMRMLRREKACGLSLALHMVRRKLSLFLHR
jgi:hypothetical protein